MKSETCLSVAHGILSYYSRNPPDLNIIAFQEKTVVHVKRKINP